MIKSVSKEINRITLKKNDNILVTKLNSTQLNSISGDMTETERNDLIEFIYLFKGKWKNNEYTIRLNNK